MLSVVRAGAGEPSTVVDGDVAILCPRFAKPVTAVLESIELKPEGGTSKRPSDSGPGTPTARGRPSCMTPPVAGYG